MKLYWSTLSPFVRKVMIAAHETATADKITPVKTFVAMIKPAPELLGDNPLSKIPTLVLDDGTPLYDSRTICEYLDSLNDGAKLFPASGEINRKLDPATGGAKAVLAKAEERYTNGARAIDHTDGLSIEFDQWRFNLRASNTEPLVRLNVESRADEALMRAKTQELLRLMSPA